MLLEEGILPIHMGAIEESIPVDDVVPVILPKIIEVVILIILDVELVRLDIPPLLLGFWWRERCHLSSGSFGLKAQDSIIAFDLLRVLIRSLILNSLLIIECGL